eukprot:scaffold16219_cov41-Attheya_sp.AAC.1
MSRMWKKIVSCDRPRPFQTPRKKAVIWKHPFGFTLTKKSRKAGPIEPGTTFPILLHFLPPWKK